MIVENLQTSQAKEGTSFSRTINGKYVAVNVPQRYFHHRVSVTNDEYEYLFNLPELKNVPEQVKSFRRENEERYKLSSLFEASNFIVSHRFFLTNEEAEAYIQQIEKDMEEQKKRMKMKV